MYRSAISAFHNGFEGIKAGQHETVSRLLKGMFNERPTEPRYSETWPVSLVTDHISLMRDDIDLRALTLKTAMLMALVSASRASELHMVSLDYMKDTGDTIEFSLPGLTKTRKVGQPPVKIVFTRFEENEKLDVITCIRKYVRMTSTIRKKPQLLLSFKKPHNPVSPSTVSRWLKDMLSAAGVDTDIYKAHSTRSASTSKAAMQGLSASDIMARAHWARASTFERFYNRFVGDPFQSAVLGGEL